jgi:hypothetical protein
MDGLFEQRNGAGSYAHGRLRERSSPQRRGDAEKKKSKPESAEGAEAAEGGGS